MRHIVTKSIAYWWGFWPTRKYSIDARRLIHRSSEHIWWKPLINSKCQIHLYIVHHCSHYPHNLLAAKVHDWIDTQYSSCFARSWPLAYIQIKNIRGFLLSSCWTIDAALDSTSKGVSNAKSISIPIGKSWLKIQQPTRKYHSIIK